MSAVDVALHGLRELIATGELKPGQRIPSEDKLCASLGVSRGPLREAVRMLGALNVLESRHGSGTYVKSLQADEIISSLSLTIGLLPLESMLDLYEIRRVVEGYVAGQAAANITPEEVARLDEMLTGIEGTQPDTEHPDLDEEFHRTIADIARNPAAKALLTVLRSRSRDYQLMTTSQGSMVKAASDAGHRQVLSALAARDPIGANAAMVAHVTHTRDWLERLRPPVAKAALEIERQAATPE